MANQRSEGAKVGRDVLIAAISALFGAVAGIFASTYGYFNKDRDQDIEMVHIALSILAGENKDTSIYGREFAIDLLQKYSKISISDENRLSWAKNGTIEFKNVPVFSSPNNCDLFKFDDLSGKVTRTECSLIQNLLAAEGYMGIGSAKRHSDNPDSNPLMPPALPSQPPKQ